MSKCELDLLEWLRARKTAYLVEQVEATKHYPDNTNGIYRSWLIEIRTVPTERLIEIHWSDVNDRHAAYLQELRR